MWSSAEKVHCKVLEKNGRRIKVTSPFSNFQLDLHDSPHSSDYHSLRHALRCARFAIRLAIGLAAQCAAQCAAQLSRRTLSITARTWQEDMMSGHYQTCTGSELVRYCKKSTNLQFPASAEMNSHPEHWPRTGNTNRQHDLAP